MAKAESRKFWAYFAPGGSWFWILNFAIFAYSVAVQWFDDHGFPAKKFIEADAALYTSAIIGILLVFRTNSAYDRWWEARKLWGSLVNDLRNLSIKSREYVDLTEVEMKRYGELLAAFALSLREHLRGKPLPPPSDSRTHVPLAIAQMVYRHLHQWKRDGRLSDIEMIQLDRHARSLMDVCGACERIKKSPIAGSYTLILRIGMGMYFIVLPWLLVPTIDNYTFLMVMISAYYVTALEFLAEEVEEPFGTQANDLPIDSICETIEDSIADVLHFRRDKADANSLETFIINEIKG